MADVDGIGAAPVEGPLRVEQISNVDGTVVFEVTGELDLCSVVSLRARVDQAIEEGADEIAFELSGLRFMDSSGIALLLTVAGEIRSVEVRNPSTIVRRVIEISGLATTLHMTP